MTNTPPTATPQSLEVALARLDERQKATSEHLGDKIDDLKATVITHGAQTQAQLDDHGKRLSALEAWRWKLVGIATGVSLFLGGTAAAIAQAIGQS